MLKFLHYTWRFSLIINEKRYMHIRLFFIVYRQTHSPTVWIQTSSSQEGRLSTGPVCWWESDKTPGPVWVDWSQADCSLPPHTLQTSPLNVPVSLNGSPIRLQLECQSENKIHIVSFVGHNFSLPYMYVLSYFPLNSKFKTNGTNLAYIITVLN